MVIHRGGKKIERFLRFGWKREIFDFYEETKKCIAEGMVDFWEKSVFGD
jgi:hypothetical protein